MAEQESELKDESSATDEEIEKEETVESSPKKKELTPEEKQARKKKIIKTSIIAVVIIGLTIGATFLAPTNMKNGQYQTQLSINYSGQEFLVTFNLTMADNANTAQIEVYTPLGATDNSCIIILNSAYKASTNSKIEFRVGILDNTNNTIENIELNFIKGTIFGEGFERKIRPTKIETVHSSLFDDDVTTVYFTMTVPFKSGIALGLLVIVAGLWITEIVPTVVGSFLVPIVVAVAGISSSADALQPFFDPVIALFFGGFIIAEALKKHDIDRRLALGIVANATKRPAFLLLILMGVYR